MQYIIKYNSIFVVLNFMGERLEKLSRKLFMSMVMNKRFTNTGVDRGQESSCEEFSGDSSIEPWNQVAEKLQMNFLTRKREGGTIASPG